MLPMHDTVLHNACISMLRYAIVYALTVLDSRKAGPLQLKIKKEGQKLGGSTTPIGSQAKMSLVTIVEVSKNLSLAASPSAYFLLAKAGEGTNTSIMSRKSVPVYIGSHTWKC